MKQQFLQVYEKNVDSIFRYSFRTTGDREVAKAITENTFKKLWDAYDSEESMSMADMDTTIRAIATRLLRAHQMKILETTKLYKLKFS